MAQRRSKSPTRTGPKAATRPRGSLAERVAAALLPWFDAHRRDLPWRKNRDPYRIWVSEIMLQQTQVATVIDYFARFLRRFPDVRHLAAAAEPDVLKQWEGLGYYRRARQLHAAARQIVEQHGGHFPTGLAEVLRLPGIGRYTAGAILSIAFDQRVPILEGNTIRLLARLAGLEDDVTKAGTQRQLWQYSESLLPAARSGDFNQALMELGSLVCLPRQPLCAQCPLTAECRAFRDSSQNRIPRRGTGMEYVDRREAAVVAVYRPAGEGPRYLLRQCGPDEWWTGLWDFPRLVLDDDSTPTAVGDWLRAKFGIRARPQPAPFEFKHAVTKYRIRLQVYTVQTRSPHLKAGSGGVWGDAAALAELPLSATGRRLANWLDGQTAAP